MSMISGGIYDSAMSSRDEWDVSISKTSSEPELHNAFLSLDVFDVFVDTDDGLIDELVRVDQLSTFVCWLEAVDIFVVWFKTEVVFRDT